MLKDKMRHIKKFKGLFKQNRFKSGSAKPEVVGSIALTGARGKTSIEKMQKPRK